MIALLIIFIIAILWFVMYMVINLVCWDDEKKQLVYDFLRYYKKVEKNSSTYIHLTFKQFLAFYNVAPEKWDVWNYDKLYFIYENEMGERFHVVFTTYGEQLKYRIWEKNKSKHEDNLSSARKMNRFIDSVLADSKRAEEEAMREANEVYKRVVKELEKGESNVSLD